ncbi:carbamoyltransferase C-terminal domain-containing protein [Pseudonocardia sp. HH130629-09]|uniref:carbamoyltransferase C-terminal domain-containing protein n=1 Tax=Pseudonocardia sp. HH130629-09 TaxID=1641402 RepID=UPI0009E7EFA4|nr:carbamoyltransferase C-terminal domain-containing protein [Pseudonocardia sp. HH130629-09]
MGLTDGLYLSTYLNPVDRPLRQNGVWLRHDNNISLWSKKGRTIDIVQYWELERLTGQKEHRTPFWTYAAAAEMIDDILHPLDVSFADLTDVWGTPGMGSSDAVPPSPFSYHSIAHLYSAMLLDTSRYHGCNVLGFAVDRGPDHVLDDGVPPNWFVGGWKSTTASSPTLFPIDSPGPLYFEARLRFGMREGTLMALASASSAEGDCDISQFAGDRYRDQTSFATARTALEIITQSVQSTLRNVDDRFTSQENFTSAVMKQVQRVSLQIMRNNIDRAIETHGVKSENTILAISGGFALNCPTNTAILAEYGFQSLSSPPAVGDGGQSLGIALEHFAREQPDLHFTFPGPYLGRADNRIGELLEEFGGYISTVDSFNARRAAVDIKQEPVAWFDGRSEIGPRALGHRSILANPSSTEHKDSLNQIKRREWWRPVAPIVLEERVADWFDNPRPSPYMLETRRIRPDRITELAAVGHLDTSARIQTLNAEQDERLYRVIREFEQLTKIPIICNTSMNDHGEPIVDCLREAAVFCLRRGLRVAYLNGLRVVFDHHEAWQESQVKPAPRTNWYFETGSEEERPKSDALSPEYMFVLLSNAELSAAYRRGSLSDPAAAVEAHLRKADKTWLDIAREIKRSRRYFDVYGREVSR